MGILHRLASVRRGILISVFILCLSTALVLIQLWYSYLFLQLDEMLKQIDVILICLLALCCTSLYGNQDANLEAATNQDLGSQDLICDAKLKSVLHNSLSMQDVVLFNIEGHRVILVAESKNQAVAFIYIIPNNLSDSNRKVKLQEAVHGICQHLLSKQTKYKTYIQGDGDLAVVQLKQTYRGKRTYLDSTIGNVIISLQSNLGAPIALHDSRLIWQIPCNDGRSRIEVSFNFYNGIVSSLDFYIQGGSVSDADIRKILEDFLGINIRLSKGSAEANSRSKYTGFDKDQILGAGVVSSQSLSQSSAFLVRVNKHIRFAKGAFLRESDHDATTWLQSSKMNFPNGITAITDIGGDASANASKSNESSFSAEVLKSQLPPNQVFEKYIKLLNSR